MTERFTYSQAPRCADCGGHAVIPTEAIADAFIRESDGALAAVACLHGYGLHLVAAGEAEQDPRYHRMHWS